jgi:hypothetical protein
MFGELKNLIRPARPARVSAQVFPANPRILMAYHDDWNVNVLLSDGRVYSFVTEIWPEHGNETNWPRAVESAKLLALWHAERNSETWALDAIPETETDFHKGMDALCLRTNDHDFAMFMRRG